MCEQKFEQEQKLEQEQSQQNTGKKILWIVSPENESGIDKNLERVLNLSGIHEKRIIYNNLRSGDELPGWEKTCNRTEAELMAQAHQLSAGDCYILDYLQLVQFSTDMATYLSMGKALFHAAASRGADSLIISLCRSVKASESLKKKCVFDWQQWLIDDADIVLQNNTEERIK